jgi:hypothetical protein
MGNFSFAARGWETEAYLCCVYELEEKTHTRSYKYRHSFTKQNKFFPDLTLKEFVLVFFMSAAANTIKTF